MMTAVGDFSAPVYKMDACDLLLEDDRSSTRKANKPLMEKRRRARINKSLMELKAILVESLKKSTPGHSKWEKADILEMTVQYVQCLKNQQQATKSDPLSVGQFIAGFSECVRQIGKFSDEAVSTDDARNLTWEPRLQERLTDFLLSYLKNFSDDATKGLHSRAVDSSSPARSPALLGRLKSCTEGSRTLTNSPSSHHSPTSGSLSPKSPVLSPGGSSSQGSPHKADFTDFVKDPYLNVSVSAQDPFQPYNNPFNCQGSQGNLLQQLRLPPLPLINSDGLLSSTNFHLKQYSKVNGSSVWRPW